MFLAGKPAVHTVAVYPFKRLQNLFEIYIRIYYKRRQALLASNPPRNNRPDSSGETGLTASSAGNGTPPDLALWGSAAWISQVRGQGCFEAGEAIQTQSSVTLGF